MPDLLVDILAAARLTRLITTDTLPPVAERREKLHGKIAQRHGIEWANGLRCNWCAGLYVSALVLVARQLIPSAWNPAARMLAVGQAAGMLNEIGR